MDNEELWQNARAVRIAEIDTRNAIGGRFCRILPACFPYQHEFDCGLRVPCDHRGFIRNGFEPEIDWSAFARGLRTAIVQPRLILYLACTRIWCPPCRWKF